MKHIIKFENIEENDIIISKEEIIEADSDFIIGVVTYLVLELCNRFSLDYDLILNQIEKNIDYMKIDLENQ